LGKSERGCPLRLADGRCLRERPNAIASLDALKQCDVSGLCRESGLLQRLVSAKARYTMGNKSVVSSTAPWRAAMPVEKNRSEETRTTLYLNVSSTWRDT
jgi:hypothetical protein